MIQIFTHLIVYKEMCLVIWFVVCKYLSAICIRFLQMMSMKQTCNVNDAKSIFMGKTINFPKGFIVSLFFAFSNVSFIFFHFKFLIFLLLSVFWFLFFPSTFYYIWLFFINNSLYCDSFSFSLSFFYFSYTLYIFLPFPFISM